MKIGNRDDFCHKRIIGIAKIDKNLWVLSISEVWTTTTLKKVLLLSSQKMWNPYRAIIKAKRWKSIKKSSATNDSKWYHKKYHPVLKHRNR